MGVAVIFPGQGTQQPGMARAWRDHPAWVVVERAEAALGEPLAHLVTEAPAEALARTREAQLAVLLTSLVVVGRGRAHCPTPPVAFAGHSLGQVTALIAAGVLPLDDGVRFAARRAELTQAAADAHPGRMAALLGATLEQAEEACTAAPDGCWVANDNAPGQVVIAGTPDGVDAGSARREGARRRSGSPRSTWAARSTRRSCTTRPPASRVEVDATRPSRSRRRRSCRTTTPPPTPTPTAGAPASPSTCRFRSAGARPWTRSSASAPRPSSRSATARCSPRSPSAAPRRSPCATSPPPTTSPSPHATQEVG